MNCNKNISETCVRIGPVRFSYCNVFAPRTNEDGSTGKYGCCVIIPKKDKDTVALVEKAIESAKLSGKTSRWGGKIPGNLKTPLRDGDIDREDDPAFAGCYFFNCNSKNKPEVMVLENGQSYAAIDSGDFYSGCYGSAVVNFFPYDSSGNRGVGAGLNCLLKLEDGEKLAGGVNAGAAFSDLCSD